jgi:NAD(P)-dependent dehydrogenase (short-subunit alcohol dehydrogenase family)
VANYDSVAELAGAHAIVATAIDAFGTVNAVLNNAGTMSNGMFEDLTAEQLQRMLQIHIAGSFYITQAAWPIMKRAGYGRVLMTSSSGGMFASAGHSNYAAAKAGLYGLAKALAFEGQDAGIKVNTLLPFAATTITANDPVPGHGGHYPPGLMAALGPRSAPEAVAPMAAYLVSRACQITGETYAAGRGFFGRVFVGAAVGWASPSDPKDISLDEVAEHIDQIRDLEGYTVPRFIYDEVESLAQTLGLTY